PVADHEPSTLVSGLLVLPCPQQKLAAALDCHEEVGRQAERGGQRCARLEPLEHKRRLTCPGFDPQRNAALPLPEERASRISWGEPPVRIVKHEADRRWLRAARLVGPATTDLQGLRQEPTPPLGHDVVVLED